MVAAAKRARIGVLLESGGNCRPDGPPDNENIMTLP
jgi:hypothetical protein